VPANSLTVYMEQGLCPSFYTHLERLARSRYSKYHVNDSFESFYDNVRSKLEDLLLEGVFDPNKGTIIVFANSVIRNEITKTNQHNSHRVLYDDHEGMSSTFMAHEGDGIAHAYREKFCDLAEERGIFLDRESFAADVHQGKVTPMVLAYLWSLLRGGCRGVAV
jgi:hypothetical protein